MRDFLKRLPVAFLLVAKWVFLLGGIFPALFYILMGRVHLGWVGIGLPVLALFIVLGCSTYFVSLRGAEPESYERLEERLKELSIYLYGALPKDVLNPSQPPQNGKPNELPTLLEQSNFDGIVKHLASSVGATNIKNADIKIEYNLLREQCKKINTTLGKTTGLLWLSSRGYLNLWTTLHRAQEALITFLSPAMLIDNVNKYDLPALQGSSIPDAQSFQDRLTQATQTLADGVNDDPMETLLKALEAKGTFDQNDGKVIKSIYALTGSSSGTAPKQTPSQARVDIRAVRYKINSFLDANWAGLVRLRLLLMQTAFITCLFTYGLLLMPLFLGASPGNIIALIVFYMTGALAGLFLRLYQEWQPDTPNTDDYKLTRDRILVTPLLCGLAAIGGVLVASILAFSFVSVGTTQTTATSPSQVVATVTVSGSTVQVTVVPQPTNPSQANPLSNIFDLQKNLEGVIWAAIFGLVPNLLINVLQQQAQGLQSQIQNAQASGGSNTGP